MDESGFEAEIIRPYGYALIGKSCIDRYNWQAKKRTNVIGALYEKMLSALEYFEQNINSSIFYHWCKHTLIPSLKAKCVIVMDMSEDQAKHCFARVGKRRGTQAKFLRQDWMENDLSKLFHNMGCFSFIVDWLYCCKIFLLGFLQAGQGL